MTSLSAAVISARDVKKAYRQGDTLIEVLQGVTLDVQEGETVAILGQSGSGKSTLLSMIAGLDRPDSGSVLLTGKNISTMDEKRLALYRAERMSIVFQQFHLMSHLTALENVSLPLEIMKKPNTERRASTLAMEALAKVGLEKRIQHLPHQLSGGEKQRVAIARAMITEPKVLLADEPSGNLDSETGSEVMSLLFEQVRSSGMSLVLVTHNEELARRCDRRLSLVGGTLRSQST